MNAGIEVTGMDSGKRYDHNSWKGYRAEPLTKQVTKQVSRTSDAHRLALLSRSSVVSAMMSKALRFDDAAWIIVFVNWTNEQTNDEESRANCCGIIRTATHLFLLKHNHSNKMSGLK